MKTLTRDVLSEEKLDKAMQRFDFWSRLLAWAAVAGAIIFILLPALWTVWGR